MKVSEKVSKEIIIIGANERTELRKVSEMAVPGIMERIVTLLYFMCLVPVRPMRSCKNSMNLYSRNILQKVTMKFIEKYRNVTLKYESFDNYDRQFMSSCKREGSYTPSTSLSPSLKMKFTRNLLQFFSSTSQPPS
ncbi:unnamed protein product [Orchesella dallaii]|uniref:Uncharacterized protein n=1 Tax=Orchesella dallaii TaxID=48710 RepID=A0ABP1QIV9_9HEXA